MVVSVRRARSSLKYCLTWECLCSMWRLGVDPIGDDPGAVAKRRGGRSFREPGGKQQAHPVGAAQIQVLPDQLFEEVASLDRLVKYVGEAHLQLPDGQPVGIAGRTVVWGERPGQPLDPAVEKRLHILRPQGIAD